MKKYRKSLKNYTTKSPLNKIISDIQAILLDFGAKGIGLGYTDQGKIESINFRIEISGNEQVVSVPLIVENVSEVLRQQRYYKDEDHSYRVALANTRDWLDSQLAYLATKQVEFPQIFLPYMVDKSGSTIYDSLKQRGFEIGMN